MGKVYISHCLRTLYVRVYKNQCVVKRRKNKKLAKYFCLHNVSCRVKGLRKWCVEQRSNFGHGVGVGVGVIRILIRHVVETCQVVASLTHCSARCHWGHVLVDRMLMAKCSRSLLTLREIKDKLPLLLAVAQCVRTLHPKASVILD